MKSPAPGDKISQLLIVETSVSDVLEVNHFTNTAKVRDDKGRILIIGQKKLGDSMYRVITELSPEDV